MIGHNDKKWYFYVGIMGCQCFHCIMSILAKFRKKHFAICDFTEIVVFLFRTYCNEILTLGIIVKWRPYIFMLGEFICRDAPRCIRLHGSMGVIDIVAVGSHIVVVGCFAVVDGCTGVHPYVW